MFQFPEDELINRLLLSDILLFVEIEKEILCLIESSNESAEGTCKILDFISKMHGHVGNIDADHLDHSINEIDHKVALCLPPITKRV